MLLEYKFGATQNYWIIKNKSSQTQRMLTEYNKSHIQGILKKNGKNKTLHNFVLFLWKSHFKNSCFRFHQVSKHLKTAVWFQMFSRIWKPDETLALVFEIVHQI